MSKPIYVTVTRNGKPYRLGAKAFRDVELVQVWIVGGLMLGNYRLDRFGGKLTAKSLIKLFEGE